VPLGLIYPPPSKYFSVPYSLFILTFGSMYYQILTSSLKRNVKGWRCFCQHHKGIYEKQSYRSTHRSTPPIFNFGTKWRLVASMTTRLLYLWWQSPLHSLSKKIDRPYIWTESLVEREGSSYCRQSKYYTKFSLLLLSSSSSSSSSPPPPPWVVILRIYGVRTVRCSVYFFTHVPKFPHSLRTFLKSCPCQQYEDIEEEWRSSSTHSLPQL
jgi:hypothetical protein